MEKAFVEAHKDEVQEWLIAYRKNKRWISINLPADISQELIEKIIDELNQTYDVCYSRKIMGVMEKEQNFTPKGDFLGIL